MAQCGRRTKQCRQCGHRYSKEEYELLECPECGEDRHCANKVATEGKACRYHGGASPSGLASPNFKHGRYSKVLPANLVGKYHEALEDTELVAMRDELALIDTRLGTLLERIDTAEDGTRWMQLGNRYDELIGLLAAEEDVESVVSSIGGIIESACNEESIWGQVSGLIEQRRRIAEAERKRLVDLRQMVTAEQVMLLATAVIDVIRQNVSDRSVLSAISNDIMAILTRDVRDRGVNGDSALITG